MRVDILPQLVSKVFFVLNHKSHFVFVLQMKLNSTPHEVCRLSLPVVELQARGVGPSLRSSKGQTDSTGSS